MQAIDKAILICANGHRTDMTLTSFEYWLKDGCLLCPQQGCSANVELEEPVGIGCYICGDGGEIQDLEHGRYLLEDKCDGCCGKHDFDEYSMHVIDSWPYWYAIHKWTEDGQNADELDRTGRTDYWEGVVHFCDVHEFISIYKERTLRPSPTGYFYALDPGNSKAVCLTETTRDNWKELKETHGDYGFLFRKRDIIALGGRPAIYLPDSELNLMKADKAPFSLRLKPYVNALRIKSNSPKTPYDYLHEREWRVAQAICFDTTKPFAVVFPKKYPNVTDAVQILHAAREFQELYSINDGLKALKRKYDG
jgi:hypothetical protein